METTKQIAETIDRASKALGTARFAERCRIARTSCNRMRDIATLDLTPLYRVRRAFDEAAAVLNGRNATSGPRKFTRPRRKTRKTAKRS